MKGFGPKRGLGLGFKLLRHHLIVVFVLLLFVAYSWTLASSGRDYTAAPNEPSYYSDASSYNFDNSDQVFRFDAPESMLPTAEAAEHLPPTFTPAPGETPDPAVIFEPLKGPSATSTRPLLPTNTPTATPTNTPTPSPTPTSTGTATPVVRRLEEYAANDVIPMEAFPRPKDDNGWGIHWIPTVKQDPGVVDRFISQVNAMHIKWVVFLNDGSNIGDNDYLVDRLVQSGIMPVMRIYRSNIRPYDGDIGKLVAHYRRRGVQYYQLYNEPNANEENSQGFANPNQYALAWASAAREVIENGGFPGIGALSPGGAFDHYTFLTRTLQALKWNGDIGLLNRSWLSVHNYNGLRSLDDEDGFLLFRKYDEILRHNLGRSLPMIGTEGGSYHPNPEVEKDLLAAQYSYMRDAEPYFFAFSHWLLANAEGGSFDDTWEWQSLIRSEFVHPLVTEFFYKNGG